MIDFSTLPRRMKKLPIVDYRGFGPVVVPYFVEWLTPEGEQAEAGAPDARPEFRAMDRRKFVAALTQRRCWSCGEPLGRWLAFIAGPMCGITRTTSEPANHLDCAQWSVKACPFLSDPRMVRRTDGLPDDAWAAGQPITRNPGVAMLWITRGYETFRDERGGILLTMGEPERVEWYCAGRPATHAEVAESIETGLPSLLAIAKSEGAFAVEALGKQVDRMRRYLPPVPSRVEASVPRDAETPPRPESEKKPVPFGTR